MKKGQTEPSGYISADPEKRQKQLDNLKRRHDKTSTRMQTVHVSKDELQAADIITFATGKRFLGLDLYPAQETVLRSLYGLAVPDRLKPHYKEITTLDGVHELRVEKTEGVFCLGARSGKSFMASIIGLYEATRDHWRHHLRRGETGYCIVVATRLDQAQKIVQKNAAEMILNSPLRSLLDDDPTATQINFRNRMSLMSMPCNSTAGRGIPIFCLIFDEIAHFKGDGYSTADIDIYNSLRPRQAQFPGAKTLFISTPAAKQGLFHDTFAEGFTVPGRMTCQADTRTMNPAIPEEFIEKEYKRDPDHADREYGARFAEKKSAYFSSEMLNQAFILGGDVPARSGQEYRMGIDQSGLSGRDRFALSICHRERETIKIDIVRSWDSTDADHIQEEIKRLAGAYRIRKVFIDRYGAGWVRGFLQKCGLFVIVRDSLPVIYSNLKSLLLSGRINLPDNKELRNGLINTVAYYGRNNSLSISHERTSAGHADLADATATATWAVNYREPVDHEAVSRRNREVLSRSGLPGTKNINATPRSLYLRKAE